MSEVSLQDTKSNFQLLMALINAQKEEDVNTILNNLGKSKFGWEPYGNRYDNFKIINNQQADPINALVEKPINSIDAMLLKECKKMNIDPEGPDAPRSMKEAVEKFFDVKGGNITTADRKHLQTLSNNVLVITEGNLKRPTITVADHGEGKDPSEFKDSLLSLDRSNKLKIPFVQGKYGMGGTGVLRYCGKKRYMLILSRKHPELKSESNWGFTLVRLVPDEEADKAYKELYYQYLTDPAGNILMIDPQTLRILPNNGEFQGGCYIRMYDYDLPRPSVITIDLWKDMSKRLLFAALPMRLVETRGFSLTPGKNDSKILYGNLYRVNLEGRDDIKLNRKIKSNLKEFGVESIEIIVFKHGSINKKKNGEPIRPDDAGYTDIDNVIYLTRNGQTHWSIGRYKFQNGTGFANISNYILVHVDMTNIPRGMQLFMSSRDRVDGSEEYRNFEKYLLDTLAEDPALQELDNEYRQLDSALGSVKDIFERLLKKNAASFSKFLSKGKLNFGVEKAKRKEQPFKGNPIPTFLKIEGSGTSCERGLPEDMSPVRFTLLTDAVNDYISSGNGELLVRITPDDSIHITIHELHDGRIPVAVRAKTQHDSNAKPTVVFQLTRPAGDPLVTSVEFSYYQPQAIGGKVIRIEAGAAANTAPLNVNPPLFEARVGRKIVWMNNDFEAHEIIAVKDSKTVRTIGIIMPGAKAFWHTAGTEPGLYGFRSVKYPWVNGTINLRRRKTRKEPGISIPRITGIYEKDWNLLTPPWDENMIAGVVRHKDMIQDIRVNMDCRILKDYIASKPVSKKQIIEENFLAQIGLYALVIDKQMKDMSEYHKIFPQVIRSIAEMMLPVTFDLKL